MAAASTRMDANTQEEEEEEGVRDRFQKKKQSLPYTPHNTRRLYNCTFVCVLAQKNTRGALQHRRWGAQVM